MKINKIEMPFRLWFALKRAKLKHEIARIQYKTRSYKITQFLFKIGIFKSFTEEEYFYAKVGERISMYRKLKPLTVYDGQQLISPTRPIKLGAIINEPYSVDEINRDFISGKSDLPLLCKEIEKHLTF